MKSYIRSLLIWTLLAVPVASYGAIQQAWVARYGAGQSLGTNQAVAMAVDPMGNVIVVGHGTSSNGDFDYVLLKYAPGGIEQWTARYNAGIGSDDRVRAMAVDADGNVYVTGTTKTVKFTSNGDLQWEAPYAAGGLALDPHNDVYVTGFSESTYATAKIHRDAGTNLWLRTYTYLGRPGFPDISQVITCDGKSNVYVGGHVYCHVGRPGDTYRGRLTIGYDGNGNQLFVSNPFPNDCFNSTAQMIGIGVDSTGAVYDVATGRFGEVIKYTSSGTLQWRTYGSYVVGGLQASAFDTNGFVYLTGRSAVPSPNIGTEKISGWGSNVWMTGYFGTTYRSGNAITIDGIGNVFITGQIHDSATGDDYVTIKYDRDGHEQWAKLYNGPGSSDDVATAIAVASDGSVYVSGISANTNGVLEITTIKYVQYQPIAWQPGGSVQLEFYTTNAPPCRIQASTNLTAWDDLATVTPDANGICRYVDTNAAAFPCRFFRSASP